MESDVNDFLGRPPNWLTRVGISIVGGILAIVFLASFVISYSDTIEADIEVMPATPPILLTAKKNGHISEFFINQGDLVASGDTIAKLNTVADYRDILAIKEAVSKRTVPEELGLLKPTSIGPLKEVYSEYLKAYYGIRTIEKFYDSKITNLLDDKIRQSQGKVFSDVHNRLQTARRNNSIINQNHSRMKTLFDKGVISKSELEKSQLEYNKSLQDVNQLSSDYSKDSYSTNEKFEGSVADMEISSMKVLSEISIWENENVFTSPIDGKVFFLDVWSPFQSVKIDEELFGISPSLKSPLVGMVKIPIHNSGKVGVGQKVIIKLHGFPYQEWGTLEGTLTEISATPKQSGELNYLAYVKIEQPIKGLGTVISDKGNSLGRCDIILKENTLFKKLFLNLKKAISPE